MSIPPPAVFGLPPKFGEWRPMQDSACESIVDSKKRFILQVCPTGFGKSVTYMTASQLIPGRTAILTSTKGLQSQLINDFREMGAVDIRGRGNYPCRLNSKVNCDAGICAFGVKCSLKEDGGCFYYDQWKRALKAKVVVTNYAYWMSQNEYSGGIGEFQMLVLDEAHSAPDHVIDHIGVHLSRLNQIESRVLRLRDDLPNDVEGWVRWSGEALTTVQDEKGWAREHRKEKKFIALSRMEKKVTRMMSMDRTWVWEDSDDGITLSPTWPKPFTESVLFLGIPKVLLTSATIVPKTAELLGVPPADMTYEEYPHLFPESHRPLIHIPTVRMNYRVGPMENRMWINRVDQIIKERVGTKGIIHTISYARRDMILAQSKFRDIMVSHGRRDTESAVRAFKRSDPPLILVSPSMATGWDFPDDECRWQIIVKLPYPDTRGNIIKSRSKQDSDFIAYLVMQQLIQATGRGVRNEEDWCETFITDNNITWFIVKNGHLSVEWFRGAYKVKNTIPKPMEV